MRKRIYGDGECNYMWEVEVFFFFFKYNWEGEKNQLSSLPAIYFSETMGHDSQGCILGFIVHFKLGYISQQLHLIGRLLRSMHKFRASHPENAADIQPK